jgi:CBS domain containing-hemolysin-like protein
MEFDLTYIAVQAGWIVVVLLLVGANGFFVAAEFALVGVRRTRVEALAASGNRRARRLLTVLDHLDAYISATQFGITVASLALGWLGEVSIAHMLEPLFASLLSGVAAVIAAHTVAIATAFAIITFLHIVLGELAPKSLALERTENVALAVALPMYVFYRAFRAPIWLLNKAGSLVLSVSGLRAGPEHVSVYTEDELRRLVDLSHRSGLLRADERELIHNVFEFADETVRHCMVPRAEVIGVEADAVGPALVAACQTSGYSRLPVYEGTLDAVVGVLSARDALTAALDDGERTARELARPAQFVPPSASLGSVLTQMRKQGSHMAIVVDEHGSVEGIVTLEDILEEIVGEIRDETDDSVEPIVRHDDGSHTIEAGVSIKYLNRKLHLRLPESSHYATLGGLLVAVAGRIPHEGERLRVVDREFVIEGMKKNRVVRARLLG